MEFEKAITVRLTKEDVERLEQLEQLMGKKTYAGVIKKLIHTKL